MQSIKYYNRSGNLSRDMTNMKFKVQFSNVDTQKRTILLTPNIHAIKDYLLVRWRDSASIREQHVVGLVYI